MPLSSALQARLIERGILNASNINAALDASAANDEDNEEIFAESYDERDDHHSASTAAAAAASATVPKKSTSSTFSAADVLIESEECIKCPNKWNPYHTCVEYCKKRYGIKHYTPDPEIEKRRRRMLKKYPLPSNWREVPDANLDRCYYWNLETDEVSWLPPSHPRSHITQSAIKIKHKEMERKVVEAQRQASGSSKKKKKKKNPDDIGERSDTDEEDLNPVQKLKRKIAGKMLNYDADPMDPSSYSDVPRGNWASGLDLKGKAKTGADETASGELFQMRPYPSPGDILRMNAEGGSKKKSKHT
ncbi:unnamed protein product [Adineta steineri]|uniref:Polyglutamine-binding protein 1 n=1 Tax=Adineta steineri TaxID=433720 RepID=A0A814ANK1_9BILA|nr:unnamed protein product [Adineta steineri]CAF0914569.1 unnamed protein product [Adineta steineri]CAF1370615.1 unnamed protein product [Adineta steineri]